MRIALAALLIVSAAFSADAKRSITETDLYSFRWIASPRISPDGSKVVYTLVNATSKHDNYQSALWLMSSAGGTPRVMTAGPRDSNAAWSPDGKQIAFLRAEKDGKPEPPQIYIMSMEGGEARQLTKVPKGAANPVWSPDSKFIAFSSSTLPKDFEKKKDDAEESDVHVITSATYRSNGQGFTDPTRPSHIWVVEVSADLTEPKKATQVTSGGFSESGITWSRDVSRIYFSSNRVKEPYYESPRSAIYSVSREGGQTTKLIDFEGSISSFALSPDGERAAIVGAARASGGAPVRSYDQPDLFVASTRPGSTARNLTASYDFDIGGSIGGDQAPPRGETPSLPFFSRDGQSIFVTAGEEGRSNLKRVDIETGKVSAVTSGDHSLFSYHSTPDASQIAALVSTPTMIGDLFVVDSKTGRMSQMTRINKQLFDGLNLSAPETIWYKSFDGRRIQAWVQRPPDFDPSRKYPLILNIHGGPHAAYGFVFDHEFQWMAAKGYIVLYPNPRGSTTYGQEFGNIIQYHYPGDDYKDLMAGVDELIARGWVDPQKLGVTGGSGGGVLTNWTIGQTTRFKAAVSQRSIADWTGFWYSADFTLFTPTWFRGAPWEQEADFKERSPITNIRKVTTPLMLIEGEADLRTPPANGGEQMFRALKYLKKPVVMVRFPGESHELSRSGKPVHRVERLQHIVAWFDKYLLERKIDTYNVQ